MNVKFLHVSERISPVHVQMELEIVWESIIVNVQ
jgi:hypothetical protein